MKETIKEAILQNRLSRTFELHSVIQYIADNYRYDEESGLLFYTTDCHSNSKSLVELQAEASQAGLRWRREHLKVALESTSIMRTCAIKEIIKSIPPWDGVDYIGQLQKCFQIEGEPIDKEMFDFFLRHFLTATIGMALEPDNLQAVNRIVFGLQSDKQRIGKTSFFRWLAKPFEETYEVGLIELDNPKGDKDMRLDLTKNLLAVFEDVDTYSKFQLGKLKSMISSNKIKVRPPYGLSTVSKPRRASFVLTTNADPRIFSGGGETRYVIFKLNDIDWYTYTTTLQPEQVWSQACSLWSTSNSCLVLGENHIEYILNSSQSFEDELVDDFLGSNFEFDERGTVSATDIYENLTDNQKSAFGNRSNALTLIGKAVRRVYGHSCIRILNGRTCYRLRFRLYDTDFPF